MNAESLDRYLNMSADQLELAIGDGLLTDSFGAQPPTPEARRSLGRNWFTQNLPQFRSIVCQSSSIRDYLANRRAQERLVILGSIGDAIAGVVGVVPVGAVACLIFNFGLEGLCGGEKYEPEGRAGAHR